jgi:6-phosphogluconolactonase
MFKKQLSPRQLRVSVFALVIFASLCSMRLLAQSAADRDNFVYVMTNENPHNSIVQFLRAPDGSLRRVRQIPTGGSGTGPVGVDPLGSQDSLVLSGDGHLLLAVNAGSNEVSVFTTNGGGNLRWRDKVWSGGEFPNSVAVSRDLVYVLNAKGANPNINGFRLHIDGSLSAIPGARVDLPPGSAGANDIRFADDGTKILVTVAATNQILVFEIGDNGIAGPPSPQPSAGAMPFGIRFGRNGIALVSEAAGSVSSYSFNNVDNLVVISGAVPDGQKASCWISLNRSATYAYISNTGSGTLSSYQIDGSGALTLLQSVAASVGGAPIDSSLSRDSQFIYVVDSAAGRIVILQVNGGDLTPVGSVSSLPTSIQGIAAQ